VNLGNDKQERIVVKEGDNADELAEKFAIENGKFKILNLITLRVRLRNEGEIGIAVKAVDIKSFS
jgi:hypothetical protein